MVYLHGSGDRVAHHIVLHGWDSFTSNDIGLFSLLGSFLFGSLLLFFFLLGGVLSLSVTELVIITTISATEGESGGTTGSVMDLD